MATLDQLFNPRSIAIVGATPKEGKEGNTLLKNVVVISAGFKEAGREGTRLESELIRISRKQSR